MVSVAREVVTLRGHLARLLGAVVIFLLGAGGYAMGQSANDDSATSEATQPSPAPTGSEQPTGSATQPASSSTSASSPTSASSSTSGPTSSDTTGSGVTPRLIGLAEDKAKQQVKGAKVTVTYTLVESATDDQVVTQKPAPGQPMADEISLVVRRQAKVVALEPTGAGPAWSQETQGPPGRKLDQAVSAPADSATMKLPDRTTVLEADLFVAADQPAVRTVIVTGPSDRELLRRTLAPGQVQRIRLTLPDGGPLTWSTTPASGGRIVLDSPEVWTP